MIGSEARERLRIPWWSISSYLFQCLLGYKKESGNLMRMRVTSLILGVGICLVGSPAVAETRDPFDMRALLAAAEDKVLEAGKSILADAGKGLLGAVLNAYVPGLGAVLGLTAAENTSTKEIIAAISADGEKTRTIMLEFWNWAADVENLSLQNDFDSVMSELISWNSMDPGIRVPNRSRLYGLVADCKAVLAAYRSGVTAIDRVVHLDAYLSLLSLAIPLVAERDELDFVGGLSGATSKQQLLEWWARQSQSERDSIAARIDEIRRAAAASLLMSGPGISFEDHLAEMDAQGDFVTARDAIFSPLQGSWGTGTWTYFVGIDAAGNCLSGDAQCQKFTIKTNGLTYKCNPGHLTSLFLVEFENGGRQCYDSPEEAYEDHKARTLKNMVQRFYGPVRLMAEAWWSTWRLGSPNRLALDDTIEEYVDDATGGGITWLAEVQTIDRMSVEEMAYMYSFAMTEGTASFIQISQEAQFAVDWLSPLEVALICEDSCFYINLSHYPSSSHLSAMEAWPMTIPEIGEHYRGLPAAKFIAFN